jgi:PAS domain S-box-containing protein
VAVAARIYLLVGLAAIGAYIAIGGNGHLYEAFGQAAWIAIVVGLARNRPAGSRGWLLVAVGIFVLAAADLVYFDGYPDGAPFPSIADAGYLAGAATLVAGLMTLVGNRRALREDLLSLADASVLGLALGLFLYSAFFTGALGDGTGLGRVVSVGYPVVDLVLLTVLIRVLFAPGTRTTSFWLVAGSVIMLVLSDAWYVVPALTDHYVAGTWRDAGWLGSYLLAGTAALHPSMRVFVERRFDVFPVRRIVLLGSSLVLVAVAEILQESLNGSVDLYAFAGFGGAMAAFITVRVVWLVRALERTRLQAEASERRFRMVFEQSPIGISVGRDGIMEETNPALQRLLGYSSEELSRMHYTEVTHPDDRELSVQQELDTGARDTFSIDKRYRRRDGVTLDTHVNVALDVQDGFGISIIEDVTDRRALEEQLRQSQKMEAVGKLAGGIAHDFNNLMTAVIGYSDLLLRSLEGDAREEKVQAIRESAVRASDLTRQLLAFSRRQVLQADELDLRDVVDGLDSLLRRLIGEDVILEAVYGDDPVVVRADKSQLEQVIVNLAVNARDAMPAGGPLTIGVAAAEGEAVLTVSDEGVGMDEETRERIFEPFFTTKPLVESSGLGLSTVHGIVGQSGGRIEVETAPGEGAVFTVRLPLAGLREPAVGYSS